MNRRGFLKALGLAPVVGLGAITRSDIMSTHDQIEGVKKVTVADKELLVVNVPEETDYHTCQGILDGFKKKFGPLSDRIVLVAGEIDFVILHDKNQLEVGYRK